VEDLLTLAQVESQQATPPREAIPVKSFLEAEIARYESLAIANQVTLVCEVASGDVTLFADRVQMAQAIGNLLDNAIKYNRPGGQVTLRVSLEDRQLKIDIEDTGIGIPSEDIPRIFERFYRVDKARSRETGGTGLGLSIVKHVAEAHGGSVQVESQLNHGSRFTLILPLA
jgi:signal transduction histidine kinase